MRVKESYPTESIAGWLKCEVGNGARVRTWEDSRHDSGAYVYRYPELYARAKTQNWTLGEMVPVLDDDDATSRWCGS